jgi:small subunit ribosomal protein S1
LNIEVPEHRKNRKKKFEGLLEEFLPERTHRGKILHGTVIRVDEDAILFDVGAKRDAIVNKYEMAKTDESLIDELEPGDQLPLFALRTPVGSSPLEVSIARARHVVDWDRAKDLQTKEEIVEVKINGTNRGGVTASFGRLRGFIPNSHIPALRRTRPELMEETKQELIGTEIPVKIIEANRSQRRLVLSARQAQSEARRRRLNSLNPGDVISGMVVNIVEYGAFVDLGGVDGLLHISEIDHKHIDHPSDVLNLHEKIDVSIRSVDPERGRISLSRKALLPSQEQPVLNPNEIPE